MKKNILVMLVMIFLLSIVVFNACKKDEELVSETMEQTVEDDAVSEKLFDDAFVYAERFGAGSSSKSAEGDTVACMTFTISGFEFPITVTIDFGAGCADANGVVRKGKIIVVTSKAFHEVGATRTLSFENYYVNDHKIEGINTVTNNGVNESNQPVRKVTLVGGKVTTPEGKTIERAFERTRTWTEGYATPFQLIDDVWQITGTTTGKSINDKLFTSTIKTPLVVATNCRYIKSGVVEIITETKTMSIDYGDGTCDDTATITIGEETKTITVRKW